MRNAIGWVGAILLVVMQLGMTPGARAEVVKLQAELKGSNEVPPNTSAASGTAEATFDTDTKILTYTVTYSGLSGTGDGRPFPWAQRGGQERRHRPAVQDGAEPDPWRGDSDRQSQAADLLAGKWYANIHTGGNPGGELRGQMMK